MNLLFTVVYAAHAKGTHHKLALDALRSLKCGDADLWQRLFLQHAKLYLEGSKAPDDTFKDFKNHVLHVRDGYWGGAPDKVRSWYNHLVDALGRQDWPTAVYSAGVLSHYYTDPLHPFHTHQSEAENNIHRAAEWSISKAYDELRKQGEAEFPNIEVELPEGPNWLAELVCRGAQMSNASYEKLIAHYDLQRGVVDPPAGLDRVARRLIAELIRYAAVSFSAVLGRAIEESNAQAPEVPLAGATLAAIAQVPFKLIAKRIADGEERRLVERMYDELLATGKVEHSLSEDDRAVRDAHRLEVLDKRPPPPEVSQVFPFKPRETAAPKSVRPRSDDTGGANVVPLPLRAAAPPPAAVALDAPETHAPPAVASPQPPPDAPAAARAGRRYHLTLDSEVVDGPSIGPKTAARLDPHGIKTIRDLMRAEPSALAVLVDNRHITPQVITDWQDQARLMCTVPGLRAVHAQLLVGAGYRSGDVIAAAEAEKLCADVLAYAAGKDGQRVLRNGDAPDIESIKGWLEAAQSVKAA